MARTIFESPFGVLVHPKFIGLHHTGLIETFDQAAYVGPEVPFVQSVGAYRWYGCGYWFQAHQADGVFDWTKFDAGAAVLRSAGITDWQWTNYNPPAWLCTYADHPNGDWKMQLPNSYTGFRQWLRALLDRYPEFKYVEVSNELFDASGVFANFWYSPGSNQTVQHAEVTTLANWTLDIVQEFNKDNPARHVEVWAPSLPGGTGLAAFKSWLGGYARRSEFAAFPIHLYGLTAETISYRQGADNNYAYLSEMRQVLSELGLADKPIIDGEHGFYFSNDTDETVMAAKLYNYAVAAAVNNVRQVFYFNWSTAVDDEDANIGRPWLNPAVAAAFDEAQADLAGRHIIKVVDPETGGKYAITYAEADGDSLSQQTIAFRASADAWGEDVSDLTINKPTGAAQYDLALAVLNIASKTVTVTAPSGWTLLGYRDSVSGEPNRGYVYYKVLGASEGSTYQFSFSASVEAVVGAILCYDNVDTANPVYQTTTNEGYSGSAPYKVTLPSILPQVPNMWHVVASLSGHWPVAFTQPAGFTERLDVTGFGDDTYCSLAIADRALTSMWYQTHLLEATMDGDDSSIGVSVLLRPASNTAGVGDGNASGVPATVFYSAPTGVASSSSGSSGSGSGSIGTVALTAPTGSASGGTGGISVRAASQAAAGSGNLIISAPGGAPASAGELLLAAVVFDKDLGSVTAPSGWTLVTELYSQDAATYNWLQVYRKVAGGSEPSSYTWTFSTGTVCSAGGILAVAGANTTTPIDASATGRGAGTTWDAPSVTTTEANTLLVCFWGDATWPRLCTPPVGMTEWVDVEAYGATDYASLEICTEVRASAGVTGTRTTVPSDWDGFAAVTLAVKSAAAGQNGSGSGAVGTLTYSAPSGVASGDGSAVGSGAVGTVTYTAPTGTASGSGGVSGDGYGAVGTVLLTAPTGYAMGGSDTSGEGSTPTGLADEIQRLAPSAIVELFEVDLTEIGGTLYRFHAGTNELRQPVVWQGQTYQPWPVEVEGLEANGQGKQARPKVRMSNTTALLSGMVIQYDDVVGATVRRKRTFVRYLDAVNFSGGNASADPNIHFPDDVYLVEQKVTENRQTVEWELSSALDFQGVMLPARQITTNTCPWRYRGAECGYTGSNYFKADDTVTGDVNQDVCGKRLLSCELRFGTYAELPFGGYPLTLRVTNG